MTHTMPELWPHQTDVVTRARACIARGLRRVLVQGSPGAGKGHTLAYFARLGFDKGKNVLVLNNRRDIVNELSGRLDLYGVPHGVLMAGVRKQSAAVQVASRDTLASRALKNDWLDFPPADLVLLDEAHVSGDVYQAIFAKYPQAVLVGFTATPAWPDGSGMGAFWEALECMASPSQLIAQGRLVPVRAYAPHAMVAGKCRRKGLRGNPVAWWKKHADGRPTVAFSSRTEDSRGLVRVFNEAGVPAEHLDAHTPDDVRQAIKERLRAGKTLVASNCDVWREGTDIPELSCCILLRVAGSKVLYLQATGRIMRAHPAKSDAVLLDHAGACLRHGLPTDDVEWSLDENDTVDARLARARKDGRDKKPLACPSCGMYFTGQPACPACGYLIKPRQRSIQAAAEIAAAVPPGHRERAVSEHRVRVWKRCLAVQAARGSTVAAAAAMFAREMGAPPWVLAVPGLPARDRWQEPVVHVYPQYARRAVRVP